MADTPVTAAPAESSAPVESTESIVAEAAADLRSEESAPSEPTGSTGSTTTSTTQPAAPAAPLTAAEKDELAEALGITATDSTKWTTRINYSKVHKAVKAMQEKVAAAHAAALKSHEDQSASTRQQIERFDSMVNNPDQLLKALAQVNPAYAAFVKGAAPAATGTPGRIETMEDLQKVIDQQVAQRLAPIEKERQSAQFIAEAVPRIKAQLAEAQTWPLFKENQAEIQAAVKALPQHLAPDVVLRMAYQSVVLPKLAANRDTVRAEVMAELKNRPHASTVTTTVSGRGVQSPEAVDTESIVRQAMAKLKD
jgi:hypothetical protein